MGQGIPKLDQVHRARKKAFWDCIEKLVVFFNSAHPFDKSIVQDLLNGGMSQREIKKFRKLTLKAARAYYGK